MSVYIKIVVVMLFVAIVAALCKAFYHVIVDPPLSTRAVSALSWRVALSVILLLLLALGYLFGFIQPHNLIVT